jgi:hypothetical protein
MERFERAVVPEEEVRRVIGDNLNRLRAGDPAYARFNSDEAALEDFIRSDIAAGELWKNDVYQVAVYRDEVMHEGWPQTIHLSIKRIDKEPIHDWRDLQAIKNELVGPEHEGIELYPAESRKVDLANQYHLWVFASPDVRVPVGFFDGRVVCDESVAGSKQRAGPGD